ncbi:ABC transporter substrate-binding protein [Arthrobacter glacialis]|uniref:ABC transporter substrate-binding protein n=1 Tax=Arthrobacter glacialis TaxID=1664 RepID=UPI000CD41C0E|nr:ABC transporter substrate-binding protein [Arthrobacter glacialis]POH57858.1 peptide ABC transporter substrate-binding protein [Arthrobacter glacialis]
MTNSKTRTKRMSVIAGISVAVMLISACSIQIQSEPDPSIPDDTMLIAADKGSPMFEKIFNPYLFNKRVAASYIYEPLTAVNVLDGTQTPWLAEKVTLPDARTIDYTIRQGVTWSDGEKFTPEDVVFTFNLIKKYPTLDIKGAWQHIESVEIDGDHVVVHLKDDDAPAADVISLTLIVPEHIWKDVKDPDTWRDESPVGTGPFTVGNFSSQQYTMNKNQDYWQADKVEIEHLVLPAATSELDIVTKGFDWAYSYMSNVEGTWGAANPDNKNWFPPGGVISLVPNLAKAPWDNADLRRGIALALDRDKIADAATEEYMSKAGQTGLMLPNQESELNPDIPNDGVIEQDTDAALASLAKAGYTLVDGTLVDAKGAPFTFSVMTANGYTDWLRAIQEVRKQLTAIGINMTIKQPQPAGYQQSIQNGDYEVAMGGMGGGDIFQAYNSLLSSEFHVKVGELAPSNFQRYSNPQTDALLAQYKETVDPAKQLEISHQLQQIVYDQLPVIGLYYGGLWGLYNTSKFTGWPTAEDPYAPPQTYDSSPLLIFTKLKLATKDGE